MLYSVLLSEDALRDLEQLAEYIMRHDAVIKAERVVDKIEAQVDALSSQAQRGAFPKELLALGIREYREVFFKPYRIVYRIIGAQVYVLLIADGRRDMQQLLLQRLL